MAITNRTILTDDANWSDDANEASENVISAA